MGQENTIQIFPYSEAAKRGQIILKDYSISLDFAAFLSSFRETFLELQKSGVEFSTIGFSVHFAEGIIDEPDSDSIYKSIIEESKKLGIKPYPNFYSPRLAAGSCLDQILESKISNFENLAG